eukprot:507222-Pyramimonas_sp.AAC.1
MCVSSLWNPIDLGAMDRLMANRREAQDGPRGPPGNSRRGPEDGPSLRIHGLPPGARGAAVCLGVGSGPCGPRRRSV